MTLYVVVNIFDVLGDQKSVERDWQRVVVDNEWSGYVARSRGEGELMEGLVERSGGH